MSHLGVLICSPSNQISPEVGVSSRFKQRRKVLFPDPEGPMTTTLSPLLMVVVIFFKTSKLPKDLVRPLISITLTQPPF